MSRFINLEEFETADPARPPALSRITPEDLDAQVSASYEQGYSAGFEDAVRQEDEARQHISAELARNLQDLSFTFHEARSHVLRGLEPLLTQLTQAFLPEFAAAALGPLVQSEIVKLAEHATDREFELLIPPGQKSVIEHVLEDAPSLPISIIEEPSLGPGQALLRAGKLERSIDLQNVIDKMKHAISALYAELPGEMANG